MTWAALGLVAGAQVGRVGWWVRRVFRGPAPLLLLFSDRGRARPGCSSRREAFALLPQTVRRLTVALRRVDRTEIRPGSRRARPRPSPTRPFVPVEPSQRRALQDRLRGALDERA